MDVIVSSGEGKPKETELRTTVYKRAIETTYKLKTESGRKLLAVVEQNFHTFPFSFNSFDNEISLRMKQKIVNLIIINIHIIKRFYKKAFIQFYRIIF